MLRAFGVTDKGRVRPTNEDCFAIDDELGLFVIADGMGGANAGEVASRLAVDAVTAWCGRARTDDLPFGFDPALSADGNMLRTAIHLANGQILEAAIATEHYAGMGTTIVAARVAAGRLSVGHAGDSRLYLLADGHLRQLTHDDSWMASMLAHDPQTDSAMLQHHPMRHVLTNVVGAGPRTDVHVIEQPLTGGEVILMTTDGVHGVLDQPRLERFLLEGDDPRAIATTIVASALAHGSRDNCTAIVACCD